MPDLRAAFYGDDVTGSVDALLQFTRRGWTGRLFVGLPADDVLEAAASEVDVIGVAGIARSLPTSELDAELRPAFTRLTALRPHLVQYKACSTADSSPTVGSLGRVVELGREIVSDAVVPMLFAQPDFGRYTAFGTHFARENGVVHRLDRQPTMSRHPVTPMTEADLAVHLGRQTALPIASMSFLSYTSSAAIASALAQSTAAAVVLDALDEDHLELIGAALLASPAPVFAIGSGGLSLGVAAASRATPGASGAVSGPAPAAGSAAEPAVGSAPGAGPVLVVSGSRSAQTRRQVEAASAAGWLVLAFALSHDAESASAADASLRGEVVAALAAGRSVIVTSDDATPGPHGSLLDAVARAAASLVRGALEAGATRRVVVCGGDTSSRVIRELGVGSLSIVANPRENVVVLRTHAADPRVDGIDLVLKGGQVGDTDLFETIRTGP